MASPVNPSAGFIVSSPSIQTAAQFGPAQLLAELRRAGNIKLCDVELKVSGRTEYVHSTILAVHSNLFYRLIKDEHSPPFSYDLHDLSYDSVRTILDWMYYGEAKFSSDLHAHFAVATHFEIGELLQQLERHLIRLGMNTPTVGLALEVCADEKTKVSNAACSLIVDSLVTSSFILPPLSVRSAKFLLSREESNMIAKSRVINVVLKWLTTRVELAARVLEHVQNIGLGAEDEQSFVNQLTAFVARRERVYVEMDRRGKLVITAGLEGGPISEKGALVSYVKGATPARSEVEMNEHMAYSPIQNVQRELNKLPNVFGKNTPNKKASARTSEYSMNVRPTGYLPPTFTGTVDMHVFLSTDSTPAFAALTANKRAAGAAAAAAARSKTRTSINDTASGFDPIAPFTAESLMEIRGLPDVFGSEYERPELQLQQPLQQQPQQQQQQQYGSRPPSRNVSSVYASPYGPSYSESQQQLPQAGYKQPAELQRRLERDGGTVIPHSAHPMIPNSQPYVEVRIPNPQQPSNYNGYSSLFKTSEYAGGY